MSFPFHLHIAMWCDDHGSPHHGTQLVHHHTPVRLLASPDQPNLCFASEADIEGETSGTTVKVYTSDVDPFTRILLLKLVHHSLGVLHQLRGGVRGDPHHHYAAAACVLKWQHSGFQALGKLSWEVLGQEVDLDRQLLALVERFAKKLWNQADDPVVIRELVEPVADLGLGLVLSSTFNSLREITLVTCHTFVCQQAGEVFHSVLMRPFSRSFTNRQTSLLGERGLCGSLILMTWFSVSMASFTPDI